MPTALTRQVSPAIRECLLTHIPRQPIDYTRACAQHEAYEQALRALGVRVITLPAEAALPDSVFVEDTALVLDEGAILLRPGAAGRRAEVDSIERALALHREIHRLRPPATLEGGDILRVGETLFVGLSGRSNRAGIEQLEGHLCAINARCSREYRVRAVPVSGCLHLKSAVTQVGARTLLVNPDWVAEGAFPGMQLIRVDPGEPYAANALWVAGTVIYPASFPRTQARLEGAGVRVVLVQADELAKAEGALTCCSLLFD